MDHFQAVERGSKGGRVSWSKLTPEEKSDRARAMVVARWAKLKVKEAEDPAKLLARLFLALPEEPKFVWWRNQLAKLAEVLDP